MIGNLVGEDVIRVKPDLEKCYILKYRYIKVIRIEQIVLLPYLKLLLGDVLDIPPVVLQSWYDDSQVLHAKVCYHRDSGYRKRRHSRVIAPNIEIAIICRKIQGSLAFSIIGIYIGPVV